MNAKEKKRLQEIIRRLLADDTAADVVAAEVVELLLHDAADRERVTAGAGLSELSRCLAGRGRYAAAAAVMERAVQAGVVSALDGRAAIAAYWLHMGKTQEAATLFAALQEEYPESVGVYSTAGAAYQAVKRHEEALRLLTQGLRLALQQEEAEETVAELAHLRHRSMKHLGLTDDQLQRAADIYVTARREFAVSVVEPPRREEK